MFLLYLAFKEALPCKLNKMSTYDIRNGENYTLPKRLKCTESLLYQRCIK